MNASAQTTRQWLLTERPQSRLQARLGRAYNSWLRFSSNRLALIGLGIIGALLFVAAFADFLSPYSPVAGISRDPRRSPTTGE